MEGNSHSPRSASAQGYSLLSFLRKLLSCSPDAFASCCGGSSLTMSQSDSSGAACSRPKDITIVVTPRCRDADVRQGYVPAAAVADRDQRQQLSPTGTADGPKMPKGSSGNIRPTHFIAVRMCQREPSKSKVRAVRKAIVNRWPDYALAAMQPQKLHVALVLAGLETDSDLASAQLAIHRALKRYREHLEVASAIDADGKIQVDFGGLACFGSEVLYVGFAEKSEHLLRLLQSLLLEELCECGLASALHEKHRLLYNQMLQQHPHAQPHQAPQVSFSPTAKATAESEAAVTDLFCEQLLLQPHVALFKRSQGLRKAKSRGRLPSPTNGKHSTDNDHDDDEAAANGSSPSAATMFRFVERQIMDVLDTQGVDHVSSFGSDFFGCVELCSMKKPPRAEDNFFHVEGSVPLVPPSPQ